MASASPSAAGGSFRQRGQAGAGGALRGAVAARGEVEDPSRGVGEEGAWEGLYRAGVEGEEAHLRAEEGEGEDLIPAAGEVAGAAGLLREGAAEEAAGAAGPTRVT